MRIVFFGTPDLAVPSLEAVAATHEVAALVCRPDSPQGRRKALVPPPTKVWAETQGIEVNQPTKLNDGVFEAWLREQQPEVCVLVAYGRILKQPILDVPPHGFLNVHPSLLPRHRGPSPIQTAILQGDAETGVTIMRLDAGTDTGDLLVPEANSIDSDQPATPSRTVSTLRTYQLVVFSASSSLTVIADRVGSIPSPSSSADNTSATSFSSLLSCIPNALARTRSSAF